MESKEYDVETANDGLMAWEKLVSQPERYRMIILDLAMPYMNRLQLIQALQHQHVELLPRIGALSAGEDMLQQAHRMGICHTLVKPFDLEAVLALVSTCCSYALPCVSLSAFG